MELGLGIDIGGTCTDSAMMDLKDRRLLGWNKGLTTPYDLAEGIWGSVSALLRKYRFDPRLVKLVGLSTSLATDSLLGSRRGRVGLIGIGWENESRASLGAERCLFVKGGHDSRGREMDRLDLETLSEGVTGIDRDVDAYVTASMFSMNRPEHEDRARGLIRKLTGKPVVASYELGGELGVVERSVRAVLNARMLPIVADLLDRVEEALSGSRIRAKIMVLRGDGSMMPLHMARETPVHALFSGPAASLLGGTTLAGLDRCLVMDVGGTSTDIAYFDDGFPRMNRDGGKVAGWRTGVMCIDTTTVALGGDSELVSDLHGDICIGPRRVLPLALAGERRIDLPRLIMVRRRVDFLVTGRKGDDLSGAPRSVYDKVQELGLCDDEEVRAALPDSYLVKDIVARLLRSGHLLTTGLTPTDIFNLKDLFRTGDLDSSRAGVQHYLEGTCMTMDAYCARMMHRLVGRMAAEVVRKMVEDETGDLPADHSVDRLVQLLAGELSPGPLRVRLELDRPIVGIGGPARLLLPSLKGVLGANVVIPEGGQVGGAVGALCGRISEIMTVRIQPLTDGQFQFLTPFGDALDFRRAEDAIVKAKEMAGEHARGKADRAGAKDIALRLDVREVRSRDQKGMERLNWIEVVARATGVPR